MRVPADAGGLADERLGGDEFQPEAVRQLHPSGTFGGGERLGRVRRFRDLAKRLAKEGDEPGDQEKSFHRAVNWMGAA